MILVILADTEAALRVRKRQLSRDVFGDTELHKLDMLEDIGEKDIRTVRDSRIPPKACYWAVSIWRGHETKVRCTTS